MKLHSHYWWDYSTREFAQMDMASVVAVQPVAAVEQHGPHLPVQVDARINRGIVERAVSMMDDDLPALVLPALPVGKSNEHLAYPGTLSFSYETLARMWFEIGESVHRAGCRKILFFNSHGGQPQVMEIVCRELRVRLGMLALGTSWFRLIELEDLFDAAERQHGIHGGDIETSAMLHLEPGLTRMEHSADFESLSARMARSNKLVLPNGRAFFGWESQDLHPAGVTGNAARADAGRGETLVRRSAEALVTIIREAAAFPLDALAKTTQFSRP